MGVCIVGLFSGSLIWIALSGMETILFLALALLSFWLYMRKSWILLGISLGLLTLTRIEGISLAGVLVLTELIRNRRLSHSVVKIIIPLVLILSPWFIYLQLREGVPITSSFQGRRFVLSAVEQEISKQYPLIGWFQQLSPIVHIVCWMYFTFVFIAGSSGLPAPVIQLGGNLVGPALTIPISAIVVCLFCLPLLYLFAKQCLSSLLPISCNRVDKRLSFAAIGWLLVFNLAYALFLPHPGTAGRYITMNHMVFWSGLLLGSP